MAEQQGGGFGSRWWITRQLRCTRAAGKRLQRDCCLMQARLRSLLHRHLPVGLEYGSGISAARMCGRLSLTSNMCFEDILLGPHLPVMTR